MNKGYEYGNGKWKDQLTKYNGKAIAYDGIGNPVSRDGWTYEWQAGRQLKKMSKSGTTAEYTYDHNGQRVKKVVNGVTTEYMLHGKLVTGVKSGNDVLKITYDEQSRPAMVEYNGEWYGYVKNLQGDIVGIVDSNGTEVVKYSYDAWGKVMSTSGSKGGTLGKANPFRYRGYVYDEETGLYYLRSRYYNPEWGRFLNADVFVGRTGCLFSHNIYAYGISNPVARVDMSGRFSIRACLNSIGKKLGEWWEQLKTWYNTPQIYGSKLYYQGNAYELAKPGSKGVTISAPPKTVAVGTGYSHNFSWINLAGNFGLHDFESTPLINMAKDSFVDIEMTVIINQVADAEYVASVYFVASTPYTDTSEGIRNGFNKSDPVSILGKNGNSYWLQPLGGEVYNVSDDDEWLRNTLAAVEIIPVS